MWPPRAGIRLDLDAAGARGEAGAAGADPHGVEGVDYTLGSVDDLDPSEWQVRCAGRWALVWWRWMLLGAGRRACCRVV